MKTAKDRGTWRDLAEKVKTDKGLLCQMMMMIMTTTTTMMMMIKCFLLIVLNF